MTDQPAAAASPASDPSAPRPMHRVTGYAWYALAVFVLVYALNFIDRQVLSILAESVKNGPRPRRRPIGLPLRNRLRGVLRLVRDPARAARRQLVSRAADGDRAGFVVDDDRRVGPRHRLHRTRDCAHRSRHRRSQRLARGLLDDLRLFPQGKARHRFVDLFERALHRRRPQPADRRLRAQRMGRALSGRIRRAVRPRAVASGVHGGRPARHPRRFLGVDIEGAAARRKRRPALAGRPPQRLARVREGARRDPAAADPAVGRAHPRRDEAQPHRPRRWSRWRRPCCGN